MNEIELSESWYNSPIFYDKYPTEFYNEIRIIEVENDSLQEVQKLENCKNGELIGGLNKIKGKDKFLIMIFKIFIIEDIVVALPNIPNFWQILDYKPKGKNNETKKDR